MPSSTESPLKLAHRLLTKGPNKTLSASSRRLRIFHGGEYIADTTNALFVWEHDYYPYYYIPWDDFRQNQLRSEPVDMLDLENGRALLWNLSVLNAEGQETGKIDGVLCFNHADGPAEALDDLVRVPSAAADQWFEEDTPIHVHPKDPFKRVDLLTSTRHIRITVPDPTNSPTPANQSGKPDPGKPDKNIVLADTPYAVHLYETGLPVRYYMPLARVRQELCRPSEKGTRTKCPYKGEAEYFDIHLPTSPPTVLHDRIWYYTNPTPECAAVAGMCCFYNEKVDVWVDGVLMDRPKTHFA